MKNNDKTKEKPAKTSRRIPETEKTETGCKPEEVEELYKTLAENSLAAVFIVQDGKYRFINTSAIAYAGYTAEELIGHSSNIMVHPDDREKVKKMSGEMLSGKRNAAFDFRIVTKKNVVRWISQTVTLTQYDGRPAILGNAIDVTDLKQAEELYKTLAESSLAAVFIAQDGKFRFINTSAVAYAGYTAEELVGRDANIIVHPDDREKVKKMSGEMLSGKRNAAFDFRMVTKQNNIRWISQTVTPIQYGGRPAILGNAIDITYLKQAEELYKILAESSLAAVFIAQDGKLRFINTSAITYAGYVAEEIIGQNSDIMVHPDDREKVKKMSGEMLSGKRNAAFDFRIVTKQNNIRWISQTLTPIQYGGRPAILGNAIDVTELKQVEELYKTLTESSLAAVFIAQDGKFRFINTSAVAYAGYTAEELVGQNSNIIVHPDDREKVKKMSGDMLSGARNAAFEFRMVTKQNNIRWISQTVTPIQYNGKPAILGNAIDVTELKQTEEALRESERLHSIILGSPFPTFAIGRDHKIMHWNKAMEALSGISAEDAIGTVHDCLSALYGKKRPCMAHLLVDGFMEVGPQYYNWKYVKSSLTDRAYETTDFFPEIGKEGMWLRITATAVRNSRGDVIGAIETHEDVTEKKRMEEALQESERRLWAILEGSPTPTFVIDRNHRVIGWNKAMVELTGVHSADVIGTDNHTKIFYQKKHPTIADLLVDGTKNLAAKIKRWYGREYQSSQLLNEAFEITSPFTFPGKDTRWLHFTSAAIRDGKGELIGAIETMTDISPLKHAEAEVMESEQRLHSITEGSPIATFVIGRDHRVLYWNRALEEMSGIPATDIVGTNGHWRAFYEKPRPCIADLLVDQDFVSIPAWYSGKYSPSKLIKEAYEAIDFFPALGSGGKWLRFTAASIRDSAGNLVGAEETLEDITEQKKAEESLKGSEERLRSILEGSPTPTFVIDLNHQVIGWNKALAELTGVHSADVIGTGNHAKIFYQEKHPTVADLLVDKEANLTDKIQRWYGREYQPSKLLNEAYEATGPLTFPGKKPCWLHFTSASIRDGKGELIGAMETMTDISPLKRAEDKLKENVAELRKVMTGIIWAIDVIVETRDPYTAGHQHQVAQLAAAIAVDMGLPAETIEAIYVSASIHDLGKIYVPAEILSKPGHISDIERGIIRTHPQVGYDILKTIDFPWPIAEIVLQHHERMDGSGYPRGLKNGNILIEARILGLADVVESMGSHRPYRPTLGIDTALDEIRKNRGILYDPDVVDACLALFLEKDFHFEEITNIDGKWYSGDRK